MVFDKSYLRTQVTDELELVNEQSQHDQFMVSFGLRHSDTVKAEQIQWHNPFDLLTSILDHLLVATILLWLRSPIQPVQTLHIQSCINLLSDCHLNKTFEKLILSTMYFMCYPFCMKKKQTNIHLYDEGL